MSTKEQAREWVKQNPERNAATKKRWRVKTESQKLMARLHKEYYESNKVDQCIKNAQRKEKYKRQILTHYGGGELKCVKCGCDDFDVLTLDHINDDGHIYRKKKEDGEATKGWLRGSGQQYMKLIRDGFPLGLQTLCANCNLKKEVARRKRQFEDRMQQLQDRAEP